MQEGAMKAVPVVSKPPVAAYGRAVWLVVVVAAGLFAHALRRPFRPARVCRLTGRVTG